MKPFTTSPVVWFRNSDPKCTCFVGGQHKSKFLGLKIKGYTLKKIYCTDTYEVECKHKFLTGIYKVTKVI